jgi:hypothetical protein
LEGAPQLRGADGGVASGQSRSCGVHEEALKVTGGGRKPPTRICTGKTPGLPRTAACHDHEDVQERVSGEMVASLPEGMQEVTYVELLCEAGRKTALSEMGAVSENVGAVAENVGVAPAHVFTACVTKVPNVDPLSSAGMQTVSCDMGAVSCDVGAFSCYVSPATATDLDNVKGMRFSGPMHAAVVPNVHDVSALY